MELTQEKKSFALLDLIKMILSFMIVAVHTQLFDPYLYPWLRLAVPLFFVISAYLFFLKVNSCKSKRDKTKALTAFISRNVKLYLFWLVALLPFIVIQRWNVWFAGGIVVGIINIAFNVFIGSTFTGSWFITALVIGTIVIFFSSKKLNNISLLVIGIIFHMLNFLPKSNQQRNRCMRTLRKLVYGYERYFNSPVNSFPASFFWIIIGKIFADGFRLKKKVSIPCTAVSAILLFVEWFLIKRLTGSFNNDFYIMLAPTVIFVFSLILSLPQRDIRFSYQMRKISTITYVTHGATVFVLGAGMRYLFNISLPSIVIFLIAIALSVALTLIVLYLKKFKYLRWLKYAL